jgi:glutaredoxin
MNAGRLAAFGLLAGLALPALAQSAYRWVDQAGRVQYSDQPPPPSVQKFEERHLTPNQSTAQQPYATRKASAAFPVTLYTSKDCGQPCEDGRTLLQRRKIPFTETHLETAEDVAAFKARFSKEPTVPTLTVGKDKDEGYAAASWNRLLDSAGYPAKSN